MDSLSPSLSSSELFTSLMGNTSSTCSVASDSHISIPGSEVFSPHVSRLRPTWRSPVWKLFSLLEDTTYVIRKKCSAHAS